MIRLFNIGGFERAFTVYKKRRYAKIKIQHRDIDVRFDISNFGFIFEISNATPAEEEYIANLLHLKQLENNDSYETMFNKTLKLYPNYSKNVDEIFKRNLGDYNA